MIDLTEDLKPDLKRFCYNVPDKILDAAIIAGVRRYMIESELWQEEQLLSCWDHEVIVKAQEPSAVIVGLRSIRDENGHARQGRYYAGALQFQRSPDAELTAEFVVAPDGSNALVPNWVLDRNREGMVHAAATKLKTQNGQPWFDPESAGWHESEFRYHVANSRIQQTPQKVRPIPFV